MDKPCLLSDQGFAGIQLRICDFLTPEDVLSLSQVRPKSTPEGSALMRLGLHVHPENDPVFRAVSTSLRSIHLQAPD